MRYEKGFTLIELLVVIAIVSILSAIALNQFAVYKANSFNATAVSDLRNGITAQEAVYVDDQTYASCATALLCRGVLPGFKPSLDELGATVMSIFNFVGDDASFSGTARHEKGTITYDWDSNAGTMVES